MNDFTKKKYSELQKHISQIEKVRVKNEALFFKGSLSSKDIVQLYRGLFLDMYFSFEYFLEETFVGLLIKSNCIGHISSPVLDINSTQTARKIVLREKKYIDWLPYSRTEKLAKLLFKNGGRPFVDATRIDRADRFFMEEELPIIRNSLSHSSRYAKKKFDEFIAKNYTLLSSREKKPVNFIRHKYKRNPDTTLFEEYAEHILKISYKIAD